MLPPITIKPIAKKKGRISVPGRRPGAFATLKTFDDVIRKSRVSLFDRTPIALDAGLELAVRMIRETGAAGKKIILVGNGGSAAIASHQAVDLWKNGGIRAVAFNDSSLLTCIGNDLGYENVFASPLRAFADRGDLLIAISSSGASPNILNAVEMGRHLKLPVIGFSGFKPTNPLQTRGDVNFYVPSHSYGIVEAAHLLLLHAIIDEIVAGVGEP